VSEGWQPLLADCISLSVCARLQGCNTFTISPAIAAALVEDPLTTQAAAVFQQDAETNP
jgi:hypothetical protein